MEPEVEFVKVTVDWSNPFSRDVRLRQWELGNRVAKHMWKENIERDTPTAEDAERLWYVKKLLIRAQKMAVARWWFRVAAYHQLHFNSYYETRQYAYGTPGPGWEEVPVEGEVVGQARTDARGVGTVVPEVARHGVERRSTTATAV